MCEAGKKSSGGQFHSDSAKPQPSTGASDPNPRHINTAPQSLDSDQEADEDDDELIDEDDIVGGDPVSRTCASNFRPSC